MTRPKHQHYRTGLPMNAVSPLPASPVASPVRKLITSSVASSRAQSSGAPGDTLYATLLSPERRARVDAVVDARLWSVTGVLEELHDPHNMAAVVRTAEGLGLASLHLVEGPDTPWRPHRKVTQDAHKWLDLQRDPDVEKCVAALRGAGFRVFAGALDARAIELAEVPVDRPVALLFGNEHRGVSARARDACDGAFHVRMHGMAQSLNVSVAAGIALEHVARARRRHLGADGDLPPDVREALRERFYRLAVKQSRRVALALANKAGSTEVEGP